MANTLISCVVAGVCTILSISVVTAVKGRAGGAACASGACAASSAMSSIQTKLPRMRGKINRMRRKTAHGAGRAETETFGDFNIVECAPGCISVQAIKQAYTAYNERIIISFYPEYSLESNRQVGPDRRGFSLRGLTWG